jgi:phage/plasmid-associated DNA primase
MAWNKKPGFRDSSDGLWRRMILIQFNKKVPDWKKIYGMDDAEWWIKSGEVPGILNWALAGLDRLLRQNGFTQSGAIDNAIDEYKNESVNSIRFLKTNCEINEDSRAYVGEMYKAYCAWCKEEGERYFISKNEFGKQIRKVFPEATRERDSIGERKWFYKGIFVNEDF